MHLSHLLSLALAALIARPALTQPTARFVSCEISLDSLDARIRRNYAGFRLEVAPQRGEAYSAMLREAREDARSAGEDTGRCTAVLRRVISWFDDPHLFLFQSTSADAEARARRAAEPMHDGRREADLQAEWAERGAARDAIEGIWRDGNLRVGIVRARAQSDTLVAIVLASDTSAWPVGAVRARFVRNDDGRYDAILWTRTFAEQQLSVSLHRRTLLRFSPGMWGREFPVVAADSATAPGPDPRQPTISLRERSIVFAIPSHDGTYQRAIDSLVSAHRDALRSTALIIVDLRGNEGGGSFTTRALHPFVLSDERRPVPFLGDTSAMLSSPEQIAYIRRIGGDRPAPAIQSLLDRLEESPGRFVAAFPSALPSATPAVGDWRVAVLTDRGTVSAAEILVLMALGSARATTIGEPTAGALDYQSANIVGLGTGDGRWGLGYPTLTAHLDLPARGMRGRGIPPQIPLDWSGVGDAYAEVERRLLPDR